MLTKFPISPQKPDFVRRKKYKIKQWSLKLNNYSKHKPARRLHMLYMNEHWRNSIYVGKGGHFRKLIFNILTYFKLIATFQMKWWWLLISFFSRNIVPLPTVSLHFFPTQLFCFQLVQNAQLLSSINRMILPTHGFFQSVNEGHLV